MMEPSSLDKCVSLFGFELVAEITGSTKETVFKWSVAAELPSKYQDKIIDDVCNIFTQLKESYDGSTAKSWMEHGVSPIGGYNSPLFAIAGGEALRVSDHISKVVSYRKANP